MRHLFFDFGSRTDVWRQGNFNAVQRTYFIEKYSTLLMMSQWVAVYLEASHRTDGSPQRQ